MIHEGAFHFFDGKQHKIALVGAGGKTTLMYYLAKESVKKGWKTLITTTTHIYRPEEKIYARDKSEMIHLWQQGMYAVVGEACEYKKLKSLSKEMLEDLMKLADITLIEADGAKHMPCKVPKKTEPVIPKSCDIVIIVMGMDAIGKTIENGCFRIEEVTQFLNVSKRTFLTTEYMTRILLEKYSSKEMIKEREYYIVLNKCDTIERKNHAKKISFQLKEHGVSNVILTNFDEEMRK